ncbi:autotransporter outer membrane beta-barrel domain-containing protein [Chitiniphilus purpureus]|uniref:Autotransporter outer membrane beta-barrel domain-containing protein n=1 Tax=Chitiniphilus purpureus TaxID=2981137 RepID=A0ABY6DN13_9NEIS|nr:autotransporter outer membrane beta-barrel domain-containing protein [Chitiniphilus sp. CD1]UXY14496.1 autotransporter outer membrane beta-barrel domain-containing protein [Chitiniphilus sp. CD1]
MLLLVRALLPACLGRLCLKLRLRALRGLFLALPWVAPVVAGDGPIAVLAGQPLQLALANREGSPFVGGSVVAVEPAHAGLATLTAKARIDAPPVLLLAFAPAPGFAGPATVRYALRDRNDGVVLATLQLQVVPRPAPGTASDMPALLSAQAGFARRSAGAQIGNLLPRLAQLREADHQARSRLGLYLDGQQLPWQDQRAVEGIAQYLPRDLSLWSAGTLNVGTERGVAFNTSGLSVGADYPFTPYLSGGIGLGYGHGDSLIGWGSAQQARNVTLTAYSSFRPWPAFYLDSLIGYGRVYFDADRQPLEARYRARRQANQVYGALAFGYDYRLDGLRLNPYGRFELIRARLYDYQEAAELAGALHAAEQGLSSRSGTLGMYMDHPFSLDTGRLTPHVRLEYQYWLRDNDPARLRYLDTPGTDYRIDPANAGSEQMIYGVGLDWALPDDLSLGVRYDHTEGEEQRSERGMLNARKRF